jgi:predicted enzyme related to lactoylglutathione lyase
MTTHDGGWPAGTPCWVDTMANDLERSQAFYRAVLGWDFSGGGEEFGGYTNASVNGRLVAGVMPTHPSMAEAPKAWTVYLATERRRGDGRRGRGGRRADHQPGDAGR